MLLRDLLQINLRGHAGPVPLSAFLATLLATLQAALSAVVSAVVSAVLLAALLTSCAAPAAAQVTNPLDRAAAVQLAGSVLRIEAQRASGGLSLGSGVMVGRDLVVTNCHVTRDATRLHVVRGGVRWLVAAQQADIDRDLCLLQAPGVQSTVVALATASPLQMGQAVTALGYTGGVDLQHSFGAVVDLHRWHDGVVVQTSNGFNSGASGGGLFNADGQLVGVLTFRLRGGEHHYFAAPASWVRRLVDAAGNGGLQPVAPLDTTRLPYWQVQGVLQPRFLQANVLVGARRWGDLAGLARGWLQDDVFDGEPWYLLGLALSELQQQAEAGPALDCALRLQPLRQAARTRRDALAAAALNPSAANPPAAGPPTGTTPPPAPPAPPPAPSDTLACPLAA